jgi:hypothetical protein
MALAKKPTTTGSTTPSITPSRDATPAPKGARGFNWTEGDSEKLIEAYKSEKAKPKGMICAKLGNIIVGESNQLFLDRIAMAYLNCSPPPLVSGRSTKAISVRWDEMKKLYKCVSMID